MKLLIKPCLTILIFISAINFLYAQAAPASRGQLGPVSRGIEVLISIIIIGLIIFLCSQNYKIGGIILTVIGGAIGVWVFTRLTSLAGKFHSWEPPFTEYETTTIIGGGIAVLFIIVGLIYLTKKREQQSDYMEKDTYIENVEEKAEGEKAEEKTEKEKAEEIRKKKEAIAKREAELDKERREKADKDFLKY